MFVGGVVGEEAFERHQKGAIFNAQRCDSPSNEELKGKTSSSVRLTWYIVGELVQSVRSTDDECELHTRAHRLVSPPPGALHAS